MNDITQLSTLYSNAIARAEKAEEALRTAVLAERERCAKIVDVVASGFGHDEYDQGRRDGAAFIAEAIRGGLGNAPDRLEEVGSVERIDDFLNVSIDDDLMWSGSEKLYRKVKS